MRAVAVVAIAVLALFACTFASAQEVAAPRFAEVEAEDAAVLAEQQKAFEESLDQSQIVEEDADEDESEDEEDEAEDESEDEEADESEEEADEEDVALLEVADEEEAEDEEEESSEDSEESEDEDSEESEDEESEESEDESEEEESEAEAETEFVLAELQENYLPTGFMEMTATFKPSAPVAAEHLVHSLSSEQQAVAQQEYSAGYAHGHADASFVETEAEAEAETEADAEAEHPGATYVSSNGMPYYASYPAHVAQIQPYYSGVPMPPQLPAWLPPPPYITPVAPKDKDG